jgi:chaperonin cofactor prefoldin
MTLTLNELKKRLEEAELDMKNLTASREALRIRIYRYKKAIQTWKELDIDSLDENCGDC